MLAPAPSNSGWSRLVSATPSRSSPVLTVTPYLLQQVHVDRRARFQARAYAFDHEHRGTRLLAWAAALDALAHTLRTIPSPVPPHRDSDRIEQVTNTAALLRAIAETDRVRHATAVDPVSGTRRAPSTPDIEAAAAVQLDQLCQPTLTLAGRIMLLNQLATQLHPTLGHAVQVLRDLA